MYIIVAQNIPVFDISLLYIIVAQNIPVFDIRLLYIIATSNKVYNWLIEQMMHYKLKFIAALAVIYFAAFECSLDLLRICAYSHFGVI